MVFNHYFSEDYSEARSRFLTLAKNAGASVQSFRNEKAAGPFGEDLFMDTAWLGNPDSRVLVLSLSGTHGGEGFCGSAAQCCYLDNYKPGDLPDGVAHLLVHAVNPFGFAHCLRVNENNVDLNRNAIDFDAELPPNPLYGEIYKDIRVALKRGDPAMPVIEAAVSRYGRWTVNDALGRGQYEYPEGPEFGGFEKQWSLLTLESVVASQCRSVEHVVYIDWHSLIAVDDDSFVYLCFNQRDDHLFERVATWWGMENIDPDRVNAQWAGDEKIGAPRPNRHGLLMWGVQHAFAPGADVAGAVIEFCCQQRDKENIDDETEAAMGRELFDLADKTSPRARELRRMLKLGCVPAREDWMNTVIPNSQALYRKAIRGAANWRDENVGPDPGTLVRATNILPPGEERQ